MKLKMETKKKILIIEDDKDIRTGILDNLKMEGYQVTTATDGRSGLQTALENEFHLIILDIMLPLLDGFEVCRQLRLKGNYTPLIILSARGEEFDRVLGLELGADDYISKPFSPREFLVRVKAILRRTAKEEELKEKKLEIFEFENIRIDFAKHEVFKDGIPVGLTGAEITILKLLILHPGEPVSRHKIMSEIWGEGVTSRTIDTHILHLREKLEIDPQHPKHIVTVHGIGYKFVEQKLFQINEFPPL